MGLASSVEGWRFSRPGTPSSSVMMDAARRFSSARSSPWIVTSIDSPDDEVRRPRILGGRTKIRAPGNPRSSIRRWSSITHSSALMSRWLAGARTMSSDPRPEREAVEPPNRKPPAVANVCST